MASASASSGRYIMGVTYSRPLLRPRWCTRTRGAPSKVPPTRPSLARNSAITLSFQSLGSGMSASSVRSEDVLTQASLVGSPVAARPGHDPNQRTWGRGGTSDVFVGGGPFRWKRLFAAGPREPSADECGAEQEEGADAEAVTLTNAPPIPVPRSRSGGRMSRYPVVGERRASRAMAAAPSRNPVTRMGRAPTRPRILEPTPLLMTNAAEMGR